MYFKDIYTLYKYKKICIRDYISHLKTAVTYYSSLGNIFFQKKILIHVPINFSQDLAVKHFITSVW